MQSGRTGASEAAAHAAAPSLVNPLHDAPNHIALDEDQRLARLRERQVLDTPPEPVFDSRARMASMLCGVPIALLCLVDARRQWFKARIGLDGLVETPREQGLCAHAIWQDAPFVLGDVRQDRRFAGHALVSGASAIRFYAGVPPVLPDGARIGTLCVKDRQVRDLGAQPRGSSNRWRRSQCRRC